MNPTLRCPICDQDVDNGSDAFMIHTIKFHRPPNGLDFSDALTERSTHLWLVAKGEELLSKPLALLRGKGGHTRHAATLAKARGKIVLNTPVAPKNTPPSDITFATRSKKRK